MADSNEQACISINLHMYWLGYGKLRLETIKKTLPHSGSVFWHPD